MPHIDVKMFPGRDDEKKKAFAEKVIEAAIEEFGCSREHLSVAITDVPAAEWNEKVADKVDDKKVVVGKVYRA